MMVEMNLIAVILFFFLLVFLLLWLCKDQAKLAGSMESMKGEMKAVHDECFALRERLKELEHGGNH